MSNPSKYPVVNAVLALLIAAPFALGDERIYQQALRSTVMVACIDEKANSVEYGTGALIDVSQRLVVTAAHVVHGHDDATLFSAAVGTDGRLITASGWYLQRRGLLGLHARIIGRDESTDVAILQLDNSITTLEPMPMASVGATPGQWICAIGNSGMDDDDTLWCYRDGSVRQACHKTLGPIVADMIETTIASNHGDSGGPVINARGELVGITHSHHAATKAEDIGQQVGYCIDVSEIRKLVPPAPSLFALKSPSNMSFSERLRTLGLEPIVPSAPAPALVPVPTAKIESAMATQTANAAGIDALDSVTVHVALSTLGCRHRACQLVCTLCDEKGNAIRDDLGKAFQLTDTFHPGFENTVYKNQNELSVIFFRGAIHDMLHDNRRHYGFLVSVRDADNNSWLTDAATLVDFTEPAADN